MSDRRSTRQTQTVRTPLIGQQSRSQHTLVEGGTIMPPGTPAVSPAANKACDLRRKGQRLQWSVCGVIGLVILAIWMAAAVWTVSIRHAALRNAAVNADNLSAAFQAALNQTFGLIQSTTDAIAENIRLEGQRFDLYRWSRDRSLFADGRIFASITWPDGMRISTTRSAVPLPLYLGDRDYIRVQRDGTADGPYIGQVTVIPSTGEIAIPISIPVRAKSHSGRLLAVIGVIVPVDALTELYRSLELGGHSTFSLIGLDHVVRVRYSGDHSNGTDFAQYALPNYPFRLSIPNSANGNFIRIAKAGSIPRLFSFRRIRHWPLLISIGFDLDDIYADAAAQAWVIFSLATVMTLVLVWLVFYLNRETRDRWLREAALRSESEKLEATNRQLQMSNERTAAASQAKSMFLENMSHELRTPLNAIIGFSQAIKDRMMGPIGTPAYAEYAAHIHQAGEHLHEMLTRILDLAEIEADAFEIRKDHVEPASIIRNAIATMETLANRKDIKIETNLHTSVENSQILGDEMRLRQIVTALLSNALKFTPRGGRVFVTLDYSLGTGTGLVLAVADTGVGMTPQEVDAVLQTFGTVESVQCRSNGGTGIGLPLARRLVELHDGRLEISSAKGIGTEVRAVIPKARVVQPARIDCIIAA